MGKDIAIDTFLQHKDIYHPIAAKMIAIDLKVASKESQSSSSIDAKSYVWTDLALLVVIGLMASAFLRSKRKSN